MDIGAVLCINESLSNDTFLNNLDPIENYIEVINVAKDLDQIRDPYGKFESIFSVKKLIIKSIDKFY